MAVRNTSNVNTLFLMFKRIQIKKIPWCKLISEGHGFCMHKIMAGKLDIKNICFYLLEQFNSFKVGKDE